MKREKSKQPRKQLGHIECAVVVYGNGAILLDFFNGHPVALTRNEAVGLYQLIGLSLQNKSRGQGGIRSESCGLAASKAKSGKPVKLPRLKVWSKTKPQNGTARIQPCKNHQGCSVLEYRVGSYKVSIPNKK